MSTDLRCPVLGVLAAIAITSTMDATGFAAFSALPLAVLLAIFWYAQRLPRREVGFAWGRWQHYVIALLYPATIAAMLIFAAARAGATDLSHTNWKKVGINFVLTAVSTILVAVVTEDGFFRGWLWASLKRAGVNEKSVLMWSSIAFASWHWSEAILKTGFEPPRSQVPVFLVNAAVIGAVWGLMRWQSGSIIVSSVSHGVWNGMAYVLFGIGSRVGALGIKNLGFLGPEVGILGLVLNVTFLLALWTRCHRGLTISMYPAKPKATANLVARKRNDASH